MDRPSSSHSFLATVFGASSLVLASCFPSNPGAASAAQVPPPPQDVGVVVVAAQRVVLTTDLPGRTSPYRIAEIRPQVNGVLQKRLFEEGAEVKQGQQLYQIDPLPYKAQLDGAQASLDHARAAAAFAQLTIDRNRELLATNVISQQIYDNTVSTLDQAKADVRSCEAAVETARINLAYTKVTSPITGRTGRSITEGALVIANQATALVIVQQLDPMFVDIPQATEALLRTRRHAGGAQHGLSGDSQAAVTLTLEDGSAYPQAGRLQFAEVTVDAGTASVIRRAVFENPQTLLLPGLFVMAHIEEEVVNDAILITQRGVSCDVHGQATALVVGANETVESRTLTTERAINESWLVTGGLKPGDRVIVEGLQKVRPGMPVHASVLAAAAK
jgi:membrane fusion protein (multidrug efflux system)